MFEPFTDRGRRVIVMGQEEARLLHHNYIGSEHMLLGLTHGDDETAQALDTAGFNPDEVREELGGSAAARPEQSGHIPFTSGAKGALERALTVSDRLGQKQVGPHHLLCALIDDREDSAVRLLVAQSVDVDALAARALELASASAPGTRQD